MINETKMMLWRASAALLGIAMPLVLLGRGVMFGALLLGMVAGVMATKGNSLRATVRIMLESWVVLAVVGLLVGLLLCSALGIAPAESLAKWLELVVLALGSGVLFLVLREMPGAQLEMLLKALAIATLAMAGLAVLDAVLNQPRLSIVLHGQGKEGSPYRLNFMSAALAVLLPYVWGRLWLKNREGEPFAKKIALPAALFGGAAALICGGRAGWGGLVVGVAVFLVLAGRWHGLVIRSRMWLVGALTLVGALGIYGFADGYQFAFQRVTIVNEGGRGMLSGRLEIWQAAAAHLLDNPLTGIGPQGFRDLPNPANPGHSIDLHPHNWLLQMLLETGLIGTAGFIGLIGIIVVGFWRFAPANLYGVSALASLAAFLTAGLGNTSIFNIWWLTFFVFTTILGWRAGWGGADLATRRRMRVVRGADLVPYSHPQTAKPVPSRTERKAARRIAKTGAKAGR